MVLTGRGFEPCLCRNSLFIIIQRISTNGISKTNNTLCGIESAEFIYLTFLADSECPENTECLPNGQCLTPCQKTSDCAEYGEHCER